MRIQRLDGSGVRNLQPFSLSLSSTNLLHGDNGSGKSSLLEAIHILSAGRSFRGNRVDAAIRSGRDDLVVHAAGEVEGGQSRRLGYRKVRGSEPEIRVDGRDGAVGDLAHALPVRFIGPGCEALLEGEPSVRRGFLDWILFHVEPSYLELWRRANRALAQRNALLRRREPTDTLAPWTRELAGTSANIAAWRRDALAALASQLNTAKSLFPFVEDVEISFLSSAAPGDHAERLLLEQRERENGYSLFGFQRDDLRFRLPEGVARDVLSRGQRKTLAYALLLAEASLVRGKTGKITALLIDDISSELDKNNLSRMMSLVSESGQQTLFTAISPGDLQEYLPPSASMFHVEHGLIRQTG